MTQCFKFNQLLDHSRIEEYIVMNGRFKEHYLNTLSLNILHNPQYSRRAEIIRARYQHQMMT